MKLNIKKILAFILLPAAFTATSCLQEVEPDGLLSDNKLTSISEEDPDKVFAASLASMYTDIQQYYETNVSHNYFGQKSFDYLSSLMGNDMIMTGRFAMSLYHYLLDYYQESYTPTANRWSEYYRHIKNANDIISKIDPETTNTVSLQYLAQALCFRGYAYLYLTYLYSYSYYVGADDTVWGKGSKYDHSQDPCVPLLLETTDGDQPRSSLDVIMTQLIGDFEKAYGIFEQIGAVKTSSPADFDGCVAATYLARAYMVKHDWTNALKYARIVKDNYGILTTEDDILQGFSNISLPDVVFGCDITTDNSTIYMSFFSQMDVYGDGYAGIGVWRAGFKPFVDRIADDDIRLQWFCCERSTGRSAKDEAGNDITVTYIRDTDAEAYVEYQSVKFIGTGRPNIQAGTYSGWELGDYIYLRSEEAYFMEAEILAHQDNTSDAVIALNNIMATRQPGYSYTFTDKASLLEEINYQKRVEFWGEGIEYLDNRRLNIPVDRTDETWGADNNHLAGAKLYEEQESKVFLYQLPIDEIENNSMLSESDQN